MRMILRALLLFIGLAASLAGCRTPTSQADKRLLAAEAVMQSHPDSALHLLQAIPHPEEFKGPDQGLYALLHTQAAFKNHLPVASDSLITIAVDYFSQTSDSLRKAWSCFYAGQVYRNLKDFPKAICYFHQAASAGENTGNYKFLDLLYYHWGLLIYQDKPGEERLEKLMKAPKQEYNNKTPKETDRYWSIDKLLVILSILAFIFTVTIEYLKKKKETILIIQSKNRFFMQSMLQLQQKLNKLLQTDQNIHDKEKELATYKAQLQTMKRQLLKMTEATKKIEKLSKLNHLQKNKSKADLLLSTQDKAELFEATNFCFDGFETRLRAQYPKLTDEDILLCCLLKMDINNQDIAILLEASDEALKKRKYRIKHDKIADMGNTSLADFLANY